MRNKPAFCLRKHESRASIELSVNSVFKSTLLTRLNVNFFPCKLLPSIKFMPNQTTSEINCDFLPITGIV